MSNRNRPGNTRPWRLALPLGLVIVLAFGWSIYWFVAAYYAEIAIDRQIARQSENGREITCGERSFGGFPFRFALTCSEAKLAINRPGQSVEIQLPELRGIVQAYNLTHAIAELTGPMNVTVSEAGKPDQLVRVQWSNARASIQTTTLEISAGDLSAEDVQVWTGASPDQLTGDAHSTIALYEGHIRRTIDDTGASNLPDFDFASNATGLTLQMPPPARRKVNLSTASMSGSAYDLPLHERGDREMFLRTWQQADGRIEFHQIWLDGTDTTVNAAGEMMLSPSGRPDGNFAIDIVGIDQLLHQVNQTAGSSITGVAQFMLQMVRSIATPSTFNGQPAIRLDIEFDDGVIKVQGNPIARTGPLYPTPGS